MNINFKLHFERLQTKQIYFTALRFTLCFIFLACSLLHATPPIAHGIKSAIIPGWGELSQGDSSGYYFLVAEIALWTSKIYFDTESDLKLRQSREFAVNRANLTKTNLDLDTWRIIERYDRSGFELGGYNAMIVSQAMERYPDSPAMQTQYILENKLDDDISWDWIDRENRRQFRILRRDSMIYTDYALAIGGVIIVNHAISFLNTIRIANRDKVAIVYTSLDKDWNPIVNFSVRF
jgi:hypothetical protein